MKNILLLSNKVFHYRVPIYNYFRQAFLKEGYDFRVLTNEFQDGFEHQADFECIVEQPSFAKYKSIVLEHNPSAVIFFMHLKDWIMWPMIHWLKRKHTPVIYWNHGVNLQDPENIYKNILYRYLHNLSDAIVLYSPNETKYIKPENRYKISIGYNTLNFDAFPSIGKTKEGLKKELNIPFKKVILFPARINPARKLDLLLEAFLDIDEPDVGLIIVGSGCLSNEQESIIKQTPGILYLGRVADQVKFNKLVKLSDVVTIPGKSGLAINQAFFWGVPYVTTNVRQSPEIWYLIDGYNGFLADVNHKYDYKEKLEKILKDDDLRAKMAKNASLTVREKASIHGMFSGFYKAVRFVNRQSEKLKK
ncbi:MAG: glycosyltransferase family 4 protein [Cyclobacteriaceae bacterium]